ncbi:hypothetical protein DFJ73DRAFT_766065 [Zopfochytrium polystomum]|nr:hypothetical protein DFJ73DRAFT_766065 [Zopfochytrium polystomum]
MSLPSPSLAIGERISPTHFPQLARSFIGPFKVLKDQVLLQHSSTACFIIFLMRYRDGTFATPIHPSICKIILFTRSESRREGNDQKRSLVDSIPNSVGLESVRVELSRGVPTLLRATLFGSSRGSVIPYIRVRLGQGLEGNESSLPSLIEAATIGSCIEREWGVKTNVPRSPDKEAWWWVRRKAYQRGNLQGNGVARAKEAEGGGKRARTESSAGLGFGCHSMEESERVCQIEGSCRTGTGQELIEFSMAQGCQRETQELALLILFATESFTKHGRGRWSGICNGTPPTSALSWNRLVWGCNRMQSKNGQPRSSESDASTFRFLLIRFKPQQLSQTHPPPSWSLPSFKPRIQSHQSSRPLVNCKDVRVVGEILKNGNAVRVEKRRRPRWRRCRAVSRTVQPFKPSQQRRDNPSGVELVEAACVLVTIRRVATVPVEVESSNGRGAGRAVESTSRRSLFVPRRRTKMADEPARNSFSCNFAVPELGRRKGEMMLFQNGGALVGKHDGDGCPIVLVSPDIVIKEGSPHLGAEPRNHCKVDQEVKPSSGGSAIAVVFQTRLAIPHCHGCVAVDGGDATAPPVTHARLSVNLARPLWISAPMVHKGVRVDEAVPRAYPLVGAQYARRIVLSRPGPCVHAGGLHHRLLAQRAAVPKRVPRHGIRLDGFAPGPADETHAHDQKEAALDPASRVPAVPTDVVEEGLEDVHEHLLWEGQQRLGGACCFAACLCLSTLPPTRAQICPAHLHVSTN